MDGDTKVEDASPCLHTHARMFQPMADLLSWRDMEAPASNYPALFETWKEESDAVIGEALRATEVDLTKKEEVSFGIVKEIAMAALEKFLGAARAAGWGEQSVEARRAAVNTLLARPQIPQRTAAWYAQGKQVLTASEFASLYKSPRTVGQLVLSKVVPEEPICAERVTHRLACMTCEMTPFDWGVRFEPVVKQIMAQKGGVVIVDSGRVLHPRNPLLAASPDGLILEAADAERVGRLVEIKCPITRAVGEGIPFEYWCQMQIQMEVTGIEECEYVEVKLQSVQHHETELAGGAAPEGFVWLFQNPATTVMSYAYTAAEKGEMEGRGLDLVETIPWRVEKFYTEVVVRDRVWFKGTEEMQAKFWADVAKARAGAFTVPESSRAAPKRGVVIVHKEDAAPPNACLISDD